MNKAAAGAKAEAEKRVKEAAITRKRAKEAVEHLASIETKEKLVKMGIGSAEFSGSGNHRSGIGNRIVTNVGERNLFGDRNRMDRVDSSSAVLAALNAVELREKEKLVVVESENVVSGGGSSDAALMEVDDNAQNNGTGNEKKSGDLGLDLVPVLNVEPIAVLNVEQQQYVQNDHAREGNGGSQQ